MKKTNKVIYWIATLWLALGMASTGIVQLLRNQDEVESMSHLGYPIYFLTILGAFKLLGVIVILIPKFALQKEWAYAGFFFAMSGATLSRVAIGDSINQIIPSLFLLILTIISWYLRPQDRKVLPVTQ